ncbi:MAG: hypothetical protein KJ645_08445, partial [Planctomycetes bacterium]|nr:hypothetical protein [Planctomycetota bacterium]
MKAIFLIALRNLNYRPGRSISCALGIALGLAIAMAVLIVDRNTIITQSIRNPDAYGEPDIEIKPLQPDPALIESQRRELETCEGIRSLTGLYFNDCRIRSLTGAEIDLQLCGLDQGADTIFDAYRVEEGEGLDFLGPPNILLSRKAAEGLQTRPGDLLQVRCPGPTRTVDLNGQDVSTIEEHQPIVLDFQVRGILAEENLGHRALAVVPFEQGLELFAGG